MRKWIAIAPLLLLAGCSKTNTPTAVARNPPAQGTAAPVQAGGPPPAGNPEPVAPPPAAPPETAAPPREAPPEPVRAEVLVPSGTPLRVRLDQGIDTRRNRAGDAFTATLNRPVTVHGEVVIPAGTRFRGHVTEADPSGRLKGRAVLALTLDSFHVGGREYPLRTSHVERVSAAHKKRNGILIGGGAGLGAALGGIFGGGKGALIGAAAGAGAGTAGAAATGKLEVGIPAESALVFTMRAPVRM